MPEITCYVAELNVKDDSSLGEGLRIGDKPISRYFQEASILNNGVPAITIKIDYSRRDCLEAKKGYGVDKNQLQEALTKLLGPGNPDGVPPVGLILADSYADNQQLYGLMFDLDGLGSSIGPRQGCAVFLDKIGVVIDGAGKSNLDFRNLVAHTAVHELGHVFNLWHIDNHESFMERYPGDNFLEACKFVPEEMAYLSHAESEYSKYVLPGGSAFRERGPIGPSGDDEPYCVPAEFTGIKLEIKLSHHEFWYFEPVELDVHLSVPDSRSGTINIPDEIDPGYSSFEIWITRPNGERRRYRPEMHFCGNANKRRLSKKNPFKRDISIFRQSGKYTFAASGRHEIQAVLRLSPDKYVASNVVAFDVLRVRQDSDLYLSMHDAFSSVEAIKLLRYRHRIPLRTDYLRLTRFADTHKFAASAAAVHYSLGRVLIESSNEETDSRRSGRFRKRGLLHLEKAANHPQLSIHRRSIVEQLFSEFGTTESPPRRRRNTSKKTIRGKR